MKLSKHDLKYKNKDSFESESSDRRSFNKPNFSMMAYDAEDGWGDALFEIHKMKQEEAREAELQENRLIVELFPWFESVLPVK